MIFIDYTFHRLVIFINTIFSNNNSKFYNFDLTTFGGLTNWESFKLTYL